MRMGNRNIKPLFNRFHNRYDPRRLLFFRQWAAARSCGFSSDIDNIRSRFYHFLRMKQRRIHIVPFYSRMADIIAKSGLPCCLMHNRKAADYGNYINDLLADMEETLEIAERAGIDREKICIDPGVGFGKTYENNLEIINKLEMLHAFGLPILLGVSRKSVIGLTLNLPVEERLEGTLVTTVIGVMKGVAFVRVHDVKENVRAIRMTEAIRHS